MPGLDVTTNVDLNPWREIDPDTMIAGDVMKVGLLPDGTVHGRPTVLLKAVTLDGQVVVLQTTWLLFKTAYAALAATPVIEFDKLAHPGDY